MIPDAHRLTPARAAELAALALGHVEREYPHKLDHVLEGPQDARTPAALHPSFHGSFDWHSCVHGHWLLARLLRRFPGADFAPAVRAQFDRTLSAEALAAERAYLDRPSARGFERPYGWAWLLLLAAELQALPERRWAENIRPLADAFVARFVAWLPRATYPVRVGTHYNTSFALALAMEAAGPLEAPGLAARCAEQLRRWHGDDRDCQAWEPSGDDFLSSALMEAEAMRRALPAPAFVDWLGAFLPRLEAREPATLFTPAVVSDRSDGKTAHLDGLNLSRAWCWRSLAAALPAGDGRAGIMRAAAAVHLDAALPHLSGDYMGEHWLASFALLALEAGVGPGDG